MKLKRFLLLTGSVILLYAGTCVAADYRSVVLDLESNDSRGQFLYRQNCRNACHDGEHGTGQKRSPMDLLMADWEKISENIKDIACIDQWPDGLSDEDLSDIFSYLHSGAADSPTPVS